MFALRSVFLFRPGRVISVTSLLTLSTWACLYAAPVLADESDAAVVVLPEHGVERVAAPSRRVELKRALVRGADLSAARDDRRKLSREERDSLTRELREAIHGVYEIRLSDRDR